MNRPSIAAIIVAILGLTFVSVQVTSQPHIAEHISSQFQLGCVPDYLALIVPLMALGVTLGAIACAAGRALKDRGKGDQ